jgi:UDP-N-acetylmuramate--alanine ligase
MAVVTNIEFDHMEHFEDEAEVVACFKRFAAQAADAVIFGADDPCATRVLGGLANALGYGFSDSAAVRGTGFEEHGRGSHFDVCLPGRPSVRVQLPFPGLHNAQNALAACAVALRLGVPFEGVRDALAVACLPKRRFEVISESGDVLVVSDYAHHPSEVKALVMMAGVLGRGRTVAVFQPHRYTRTRALCHAFPPAFVGADEVVLTPVYAASEKPLEGGTAQDLYKAFSSFGQVPTRLASSLQEAWDYLRCTLVRGDTLLVTGAGDVEQIARWARAWFGGECEGE